MRRFISGSQASMAARASHYNLALLVLSLSALSGSLGVFVSIDCGSSGNYTDENSIAWTGDENLFTQTETHTHELVVKKPSGSIYDPEKCDLAMRSLRAFPSGRKNCYSIPAKKGEKVLVRARFCYGNYDGNDTFPIFDLHLDGNHWETVIGDGYYSYRTCEAIYVPRSNAISVCLAQTLDGHIPFISTLEVRSLSSDMYSNVNPNLDRALILRGRIALGIMKTVRYPDDAYDRLWEPLGDYFFTKTLTLVQSEASLKIDVNALQNKPPPAVLRNARNTYLLWMMSSIPSVEYPLMSIHFYFSEPQKLNSTQKRSFEVYHGQYNSGPIIPPYGSVSEIHFSNITNQTLLHLRPTSDSTLSPLVNAFEIFCVSKTLTDGTNTTDVRGLELLKGTFDALREWRGDPCLPSPFTWEWINCSANAMPRVIALYLDGFNLSGALPDFSFMDALQTIDLHNNSLDGPIPEFLASLPNLRELNLADNNFSGSIPTSLSENSQLKLMVSGNPNLSSNDSPGSTSNPNFLSNESPGSTSNPNFLSNESPGSTIEGKNTNIGRKSNKQKVVLGTAIAGSIIFIVIVGLLARILHNNRKPQRLFRRADAKIRAEQTCVTRPNAVAQGTPSNVDMVNK